MAHDYATHGKRTRGKRAGASHAGNVLKDIHSTLDGRPSGTHSNHAHNLKGSSATALVASAAMYFEGTELQETAETHLIPRQSLTRKQLLRVLPPTIETETMHGKQLNHATGKMVEITDERMIYRSPRTMLRTNDPFTKIGTYKREGAIVQGLNRQTFRETRNEDAARIVDEVLTNVLDDDDLSV